MADPATEMDVAVLVFCLSIAALLYQFQTQ